MALVTQYRKHGETIDLHVDTSGQFHAEHDGETYRGKTLEELTQALDKMFTARKHAVIRPVSVCNLAPNSEKVRHGYRREPYERGIGIVHGSYRGKHGRTTARMFTAEDGTKFQLDSWSNSEQAETPFVARLLTPAEEAEYQLARQAYEQAKQAILDFKARVQADLRSWDSETNG